MVKDVDVPFLPGNTFSDPRKTNFRKPQTLGYKNGHQIHVPEPVTIGGEKHLYTTLKSNKSKEEELAVPDEKELMTLTYGANTSKSCRNATDFIPAHIAYDKKVLSFKGFFKELVPESPTETYRIRPVVINYFLEDDSINIWEPRIPNSGMIQGMLLKRQRVPLAGSPRSHITPKDLNVASNISIFGRTYRLYDCDKFSRDYYSSIGLSMNEPEPLPTDSYTKIRKAIEKPPRMTPPPNPEKLALKRFLENDRKVLRFYCSWDNREALFGERRPYVLHYFLVDGTIEVREVNSPNDGRDAFPVFLRRQKLPKKFGGLDDLKGEGNLFTDKDLGIGKIVSILGRPFLLYDADAHTREYYKDVHGITEWPEVQVEESVQQTLPNKDSSIRNRARQQKRIALEGFIDSADYEGRSFVVCFSLADDLISVFETGSKTCTGSRKFVDKLHPKNPARVELNLDEEDQYFQATDFFIGARVAISSWTFVLEDADEWALKYMEANPFEFPFSNLDWVQDNLAGQISSVNSLRQSFESISGNGMVSRDEFRDVLISQRLDLVEQELITLARRYDLRNDNCVSYEDFLAAISAIIST